MIARSRQPGFTLIEVTLAIVIGLIVMSGAVVLYNQAKSNAASGKMQEKVIAVAGMVEHLAARNNGVYPSADQLRLKYQRERADDYLMSPWGGPVGAAINNAGVERGIGTWNQNLAVAGGPTQQADDGASDLRGGLQYWLVATPEGTVSLYDKTREKFVTYRGYVVSGVNPDNYDGWVVVGPQP